MLPLARVPCWQVRSFRSGRAANHALLLTHHSRQLSRLSSPLYSSQSSLSLPRCPSSSPSHTTVRRFSPASSPLTASSASSLSSSSSSPRDTNPPSSPLSLPKTPTFQLLAQVAQSKTQNALPAVVHSSSNHTFSYPALLRDVASVKSLLLQANATHPDWNKHLSGQRIAFLVESSYSYVVSMLAIMACDAIAVPMSPGFAPSELDYILFQSGARYLLTSEANKKRAEACEQLHSSSGRCMLLTLPSLGSSTTDMTGTASSVHFVDEFKTPTNGGMMLYTSGTTNKPKGVLLPEAAILAQVECLRHAWNYSPEDRLLNVLPLHHIHGIINGLLTPLLSGTTVEFLTPFNASTVWKRLAAPFLPHPSATERLEPITIFTAVPTIYSRLLDEFPRLPDDIQNAARTAISPKHLRLCMSGSAALPAPIMESWTNLSGGNVLLERYGMTEIGMALSCGLSYEDRVSGSVGWPLPSVEVRLVDSETGQVIAPGEEVDAHGNERLGEIQVRGPTIFREYWRNPAATESEFTSTEAVRGAPEWFKTGDIAIRRHVPGAGENREQRDWATGPMYFIQGRKSADIIKTGGEKVSALEVEREMLALPEIAECAVVGIDSDTWGQKVAAVVVLTEKGRSGNQNGKPFSALDLRRALKDRLSSFKMPQEMKVVDEIPRNAMGKINKKMLVKELF